MDTLNAFHGQAIKYVETQDVSEGVEADLYTFDNDNSRDLAIVRVAASHKTPLQRILKGKKTVEGYMEGRGSLSLMHSDGSQIVRAYPDSEMTETIVEINDIMQWSAETNLTFYEICWPPYEDGRFENLT
ncbi:MAG TPA: hypothetical protein VF572_04070 [Candidatus Saccharimonadales bacterium]